MTATVLQLRTEIRSIVDGHDAYNAADVAAKLIANQPELIDAYLTESITAIVLNVLAQARAADRPRPASVFARYLRQPDGETGDAETLARTMFDSRYRVDGLHRRLGSLTRPELYSVADAYDATAKGFRLKAAWLRTLAARMPDDISTVENALAAAELMATLAA